MNYSNNDMCPQFVVVSMPGICEISIHQAILSENVFSHYNKVYANELPMRLCNKHLISYTKKQLNKTFPISPLKQLYKVVKKR